MTGVGCEKNPNCTYALCMAEGIDELRVQYDEAVEVRNGMKGFSHNVSSAKKAVWTAKTRWNELSVELITEMARCEGDVCALALTAIRDRIEQTKERYY